MDLIVLHHHKQKKGQKKFHWKKYGSVWWLGAPSSYTTRESYLEIVRFFTSRSHRPIKLWVDDVARGHNTPNIDNFMKSVGIERVRVQGCCTSIIQAADRPNTNQKLKRIAKEILQHALFDKITSKGSQTLLHVPYSTGLGSYHYETNGPKPRTKSKNLNVSLLCGVVNDMSCREWWYDSLFSTIQPVCNSTNTRKRFLTVPGTHNYLQQSV